MRGKCQETGKWFSLLITSDAKKIKPPIDPVIGRNQAELEGRAADFERREGIQRLSFSADTDVLFF